MQKTPVLYGQSNYDLTLKVYGSLDRLILFCKQNKIEDLDIPPSRECFYNPDMIVDKNVTGFNYASRPL